MNRKILIILVGLLIGTGAKSSAQNLKLGLLGGYDIVTIHQPTLQSGATGPPYHPMKSYNFNCFISYKGKGPWGFSVEPGFIQKGASCSALSKCKYKLDYFQIPCLVDVYVLHKLYFSGGLEFAYMMNAKASYPDRTDDIYSGYKNKYELSGLTGINYKVTKRIDIGLRYNHGLTYLLNEPIHGANGETRFTIQQYNQYVQFIVRFTMLN